jgi:hypothetical protein
LKVVFREKKKAESRRNENRRLTDTAPNWIEEMKQAQEFERIRLHRQNWRVQTAD